MKNRLLIGAAVVIATIAAVSYATKPPGPSGRNRDVRADRAPQVAQDATPTLSTEDVPSAPSSAAPVDHAPDPSDVARAAGPISWQSSFSAATDSAKPDQVIFVDVYTDWCGWCKYMDQRVYTDEKVQSFAANQVFVKLNAEDRGEGTAFARRAGVQGYPTLLVFSHDGRLIAKQPGAFRNPNDFLSWIREATARQ